VPSPRVRRARRIYDREPARARRTLLLLPRARGMAARWVPGLGARGGPL